MNSKFHSLSSAFIAVFSTFFIMLIMAWAYQFLIYNNFTPNNRYKNKVNTPIVMNNDSYTKIYHINPHNNNIIEFYDSELKTYIKDFIAAKDRYSIFKSRIQYGLALGCINKELKHSKIDWWEESSNYRKNARNYYAKNTQQIQQSKENELFLFKNKNIFDFDLIKDIDTTLLYPVNPKEEDFCTKLTPINEVYTEFMNLYLDRYDTRNKSKKWFKSLEIFHPDYFKHEKQLELTEDNKKRLLKKKLKKEKYARYIQKQNKEKFIKLKEYIKAGKDIEIRNKYGRTLLHVAVAEKNLESIELLLKNGANMYARDRDGPDFFSPFNEASKDMEIFKLFLKYGVDVNYQYKKSETALTDATKGCKNFEYVKLLLSKGANPDLIDEFTFTTKTGLFRYCKKGEDYNKMMKLLKTKY